MELIWIILTFVFAYGIFMFLAYVLARLFFPTIEVEDDDIKVKSVKTRHEKRLTSRTAH